MENTLVQRLFPMRQSFPLHLLMHVCITQTRMQGTPVVSVCLVLTFAAAGPGPVTGTEQKLAARMAIIERN